MDYFRNKSTIHGIRYVAEGDDWSCRRLLWILIFIAACAGFLVNATQRFSLFLSKPLTVNIEVKYAREKRMPAVTICNQNIYRVSKAAQLGIYPQLKEIIKAETSRDNDTLNSFEMAWYWNSTVSLYDELAHKKEDMIFRCWFGGATCTDADFVKLETDFGVCYTFGGPAQAPKIATSSGSLFGLNLILNIEQYEYMGGPHTSAGMKIHLHDSDEMPFVGDMGFDVPPGRQTLIGINARRVIHMNTEGTTCMEDRPLEILSDYNYTEAACYFECQLRYLMKNCSCYPVGVNAAQVKKSFEDVEDTLCADCVPTCDTSTYTPTISHAALSQIHAANLLSLRPAQIPVLQANLLRALESTARNDPDEIARDNAIALNYSHLLYEMRRYDVFPNAKAVAAFAEQHSQLHCFKRAKASVEKVWQVTLAALHEIAPVVVQLTDIDAGYLMTVWRQALVDVVIRIRYLKEHDLPLIFGTLRRANLTRDEYSLEVKFILQGVDSQLFAVSAHAKKLAGTFPAAQRVLDRNPHLLRHPKLVGYFRDAQAFSTEQLACLDELAETMVSAFDNVSRVLSTSYSLTSADEVQAAWLNANDSIDAALRIREACQRNFINNAVRLDSLSFARLFASVMGEEEDQINSTFRRLESSFQFTRTFSFGESEAEQAISMITNYQQLYVDRQITKLELAKGLTSSDLQGQRVFIADFFTNVRRFAQTMQNAQLNYLSVAAHVEGNLPSMVRQYLADRNESEIFAIVTLSTSTCKAQIEATTKERVSATSSVGQELLRWIGEHSLEVTDYMASAKLDYNFILKNFVDISIYYPELREELITQQEAYNVFGLLCDVGGGLGLFVGASAISVCELLDLLVSTVFSGVRQLQGIAPSLKDEHGALDELRTASAVTQRRMEMACESKIGDRYSLETIKFGEGKRTKIPTETMWLNNLHIYQIPL